MSRGLRKGLVYGKNDKDDTIAFAYKRPRPHQDQPTFSKRPHPDLEDICSTPAISVLLRRVFYLNVKMSRYVSIGLYPADNYQVLAEFGGLRIAPIILTEQHVKTLVDHLRALCEAIHCGEYYTCKDGPFRLQSG